MLGRREELGRFREKYRPRFPTQAMAPMEFLSRIGSAPPRFILIRDGKARRHWDEKAPSDVTILRAVLEIQ